MMRSRPILPVLTVIALVVSTPSKTEDWLLYAGQEYDNTLTEISADASKASIDHRQDLRGLFDNVLGVQTLKDAEKMRYAW